MAGKHVGVALSGRRFHRLVRCGLSALALGIAAGLLCGCGGSGGGGDGNGNGNGSGPTIAFDAQRSFSDLQAQVDCGPRAPGSRGHADCRDLLIQSLTPLVDSLQRQDFTVTVDSVDFALTNIIGVINPGQSRSIVLGAHWDTRPVADQDPNPANRNTPIDGANDGASGVAVLLEIARQLKSASPTFTVTIVFFDGEDFGQMFYGSRQYAASLSAPKPDEGIVADMVGDRDLVIEREFQSQQRAPDLFNALWQCAADLGFAQAFAGRSITIFDDHIPLNGAGVPTVDLIDFSYGPNNSYWHTLADTVDKCSADSLDIVGRTVLRYLLTKFGA